MSSTFTPSLNLQCMAVGDQSNTWGTLLNSSVFTNIDQALGQSFATSVAGSSNYTLSQSNALCLEHILTGVLSGNIQYIFPASAGRIVRIINNTTGAFTLTVLQSGGTGVVVPQGETSFIALSANTTTATMLLSSLGNSPSVGVPSGTTGALRMFNANSTNVTTIKSGTSTAPWTLTLPINAGSANQYLQTDGTGNASWVTSTAIIGTNVITNTNLAQMAPNTVKLNSGTSTANATDFALGTNSLLGMGTGNISQITLGTSLNISGTSLGITAAVKADQTAGTSTALPVVPAIQQNHASAAKGWVLFTGTSTVYTAQASYGYSSFVRNGLGDVTITWANSFTSANYGVVAIAGSGASRPTTAYIAGLTSNTTRIRMIDSSNAPDDSSFLSIVAYGAQ